MASQRRQLAGRKPRASQEPSGADRPTYECVQKVCEVNAARCQQTATAWHLGGQRSAGGACGRRMRGSWTPSASRLLLQHYLLGWHHISSGRICIAHRFTLQRGWRRGSGGWDAGAKAGRWNASIPSACAPDYASPLDYTHTHSWLYCRSAQLNRTCLLTRPVAHAPLNRH